MNSADFCDLFSFFKYEESGAFLCHLEGSCKLEIVMVQSERPTAGAKPLSRQRGGSSAECRHRSGRLITIRSKPQRVHTEVQAVDSLVVGGCRNSVFIVSVFSAK